MGSASEQHYKGIDETFGTLVWVQRRNGLWWPGQIISSDECPEDFLGSLGVGIPIKLLGREDVPVDWYKRVKPFRCGDFDDCINKAILGAPIPDREVIKNDCREDAILLALKIEERSNTSVQGVVHDPNKARGRRTPYDSVEDEFKGVKGNKSLQDLGRGPIAEVKSERIPVVHVQELPRKKCRSRSLKEIYEILPLVSAPVISQQLPSPVDVPLVPSRLQPAVMNPYILPGGSQNTPSPDSDELYDVIVQVNARTRHQRVPFTSLMSKFTSSPVVGHPLPVEVLEDNFTGVLIRKAKGRISNERDGKQKIRRLSEITGSCRRNEGATRIIMEDVSRYPLACIPLRVAYCRLKENLRN